MIGPTGAVRVMMSAADVEAIVRASVTFGGGETDMAALAFIDPGGTGDEFDAAARAGAR